MTPTDAWHCWCERIIVLILAGDEDTRFWRLLFALCDQHGGTDLNKASWDCCMTWLHQFSLISNSNKEWTEKAIRIQQTQKAIELGECGDHTRTDTEQKRTDWVKFDCQRNSSFTICQNYKTSILKTGVSSENLISNEPALERKQKVATRIGLWNIDWNFDKGWKVGSHKSEYISSCPSHTLNGILTRRPLQPDSIGAKEVQRWQRHMYSECSSAVICCNVYVNRLPSNDKLHCRAVAIESYSKFVPSKTHSLQITDSLLNSETVDQESQTNFFIGWLCDIGCTIDERLAA